MHPYHPADDVTRDCESQHASNQEPCVTDCLSATPLRPGRSDMPGQFGRTRRGQFR